MDYFPHDTHAMSDDKVLALRIDAGLGAVACYWAILEKIYADEEPFDISETNVETKSVLLRLGVGFDTFKTWVFHMLGLGLFYAVDGDSELLMSERAEQYIEALDKKRETARQNGKKGGRRPKARNQRKTNVGSNAETKSVPTSPHIKHKTLNNKESASGAAVSGTAPQPLRAVCPLCKSPLQSTGMPGEDFWWCESCQEFFAEGKEARKS